MGPGKVGLLNFFDIGRGSVAPPSILGSGFGRTGRSLTGFRRGNVANLSAVAFVSRAAATISIEVIPPPPPPLMDVEITGELNLGRRPSVANRSSVRLGGVDGFDGVIGFRITEGCLPDARKDFAAAAGGVAVRMLLLRLGVIGLSGVLALRLDG